MTTTLTPAEVESLLPLALGHDQDASACPWVQITRSTAYYPSRKAQAALAVSGGALPPTADLLDQLYRCDGCGRCLAESPMSAPPDLARSLWRVRASLVAAGTPPEVVALAGTYRIWGNLYGDLSPAIARLGAGESGADVLFVPGAATLHHAPEATLAALQVARALAGSVAIDGEVIDSGQEALELGLATDARALREGIRRRVAAAGYRLVLAGTPKEAFGLVEALSGLPVEVRYLGEAIASAAVAERRSPPRIDGDGGIAFHPSESLLHRLSAFEIVDTWLVNWLGERYRREVDPRRDAWPAAIERPAVRVPPDLMRAMAERRLSQLLAAPGADDLRVILTCDPWSWRALREVAPAGVEVVDLLVLLDRFGDA